MPKVRRIPDNYPRVSPHLSIAGAAGAIDFYTSVLGATERGGRFTSPDGTLMHAEISIGDSVIMIGDETAMGGSDPSPKTLGGSPVSLYVYVDDVDDVYNRALQAGAQGVHSPKDQFYGDRVAHFDDPFGHRWTISTHIEDVSPEQMKERLSAAMTA